MSRDLNELYQYGLSLLDDDRHAELLGKLNDEEMEIAITGLAILVSSYNISDHMRRIEIGNIVNKMIESDKLELSMMIWMLNDTVKDYLNYTDDARVLINLSTIELM